MSEKAKWTPAPWMLIGPDDNIHVVRATNPNMRICFMTSNGNCVENAQLISAAPAMAEALENLLKWVRPIAGDNRDDAAAANELKTVAEAEAALALAHGESK